MSYDISLYPRGPGQDWAEVIEADQVDGPAMDQGQLDAGVATFRRIEARLREQLTEPVEVWVAEETDGDVVGELTGTATGLRVELYDRSAEVSFPVVAQRSTEARAALHDAARRAVRVVAEETGYEAYDAQTRRGFDGVMDEDGLEADDFAPAQGYDEGQPVVGSGTEVAGAGAPAGGATAPTSAADAFSRMEPGMLRRRATLYLVVGGLMVAYGFWRFSVGDGGWLTWLVVAFAVFNLMGGFMLQKVARQAQERRDGEAAGAPGTGPVTDPGAGPTEGPVTGTAQHPEDGTPPQR